MREEPNSPRTSPSLYDALGVAAPAAATQGETALTAAKETLDRDHEDEFAAPLLDRT